MMQAQVTHLVPRGQLALVNLRHLARVLLQPFEVVHHTSTTSSSISHDSSQNQNRRWDLQIAHANRPRQPHLLRLFQSLPLNPPPIRPIIRIMNQEKIHIPTQTNLLHTLPDPFQCLFHRRTGLVDLGDDEEVRSIDLVRVSTDGGTDFRLVVVLLGGVEGEVAGGEGVVDWSRGGDTAGTEDVAWDLRGISDSRYCRCHRDGRDTKRYSPLSRYGGSVAMRYRREMT